MTTGFNKAEALERIKGKSRVEAMTILEEMAAATGRRLPTWQEMLDGTIAVLNATGLDHDEQSLVIEAIGVATRMAMDLNDARNKPVQTQSEPATVDTYRPLEDGGTEL